MAVSPPKVANLFEIRDGHPALVTIGEMRSRCFLVTGS